MLRSFFSLSVFLALALVGSSSSLYGQDRHAADSLAAELSNATEDSSRCRLLLEIATVHHFLDTLQSMYFINQAEELANHLEDRNYLGRVYELKGEIHTRTGEYKLAIIEMDRSLSFYNQADNHAGYYEALKDKGNIYLYLSEYSQALVYYETALDFYRRNDMPEGASRCLNNMGIIYKNRGDYVEALSVYEESIRIIEGFAEPMQLARGYINMGNVFVLLGSYDEALSFYMQALNIAEEEGSEHEYALSLLNTGVLQNKCGNYEEAGDMYGRALSLGRNLGDPVLISNCLINLGTNYSETGHYEKALDFVSRGQAMKIELEDDRAISSCLIHLADIHSRMDNYHEAYALYNEALLVKENLGDVDGLARCYLGLASVELERENYQMASTMSEEALNLAQEISALEHMAAAYAIKETAAAIMGDYRSAYDFSLENRKISDSLLDGNTARAVMDMEFRHRSKALANENESLKIQSRLASELMKKRNALMYSIVGLAILMAAGLVLGIIFLRSLRSSSQKLEEKNLVITRQNLKLDEMVRSKDQMMSIIAHDLRGTIGNQLTAVDVLNKLESSPSKEIDKAKLLSNLKHSASYSLELLENLLQWSRLEDKKTNFMREDINLGMVMRSCVSLFDESARVKGITIQNSIQKDFSLYADKIMLETIVRNLLSNAIKFSGADSTILISAEESGENLIMKIKDEGVGMKPEQLEKILNNGGYSSRGTANEKGAGIGMTLIREFTSLHGGRLSIESEEGKGSCVFIEFPLKAI